MISHKYQCIFIHIPKCAGTSIEAALGHLDCHSGRGGQDHRTIRMIENPFLSTHTFSSKENIRQLLRRFKHQKFNRVQNPKNRYTVTKPQYRTYFKFTVVRNPWARAFSWYRNVMRDEVHREEYGITTDLSLNEFLKLYVKSGMLSPQIYWLKNFRGEIELDYIGRFENLQEDFSEICRRMNLPQIELPHKIKGGGQDYRDFYDEVSKRIIYETYYEEIRMFDYSFD